MSNTQIIRQDFEEYQPKYNEVTGEYFDHCPYEKFSRTKKITYSCPCISGRSINTRQQFLQHFNTKTHNIWRNNIGKDENKKIIKDLHIENAKKDNIIQKQNNKVNSLEKDISYKQNSLKLQARQLKKIIQQQKITRKEISLYISKLKLKNDLIIDLEENVKMLEEASNLSIDYETSNDEVTKNVARNYSIESINDKSNGSMKGYDTLSDNCSVKCCDRDSDTFSDTCSDTFSDTFSDTCSDTCSDTFSNTFTDT